jgi:hypothetical protein
VGADLISFGLFPFLMLERVLKSHFLIPEIEERAVIYGCSVVGNFGINYNLTLELNREKY